MIRITRVTSLADCDRCREIAAAVWGSDAACSTPQMSVHAAYGGVVLLAWDDDKPVGFLFSFPAQYLGSFVLWSHETAVLPAYLHQGIGTELKRTQRRYAAEMGYDQIAWTYDPLVARNAHFNLNKLGARISEYKINAYGVDDTDLVNQGVETDRFIAVWDTGRSGLAGSAGMLHPGPVRPWQALMVGEDGNPHPVDQQVWPAVDGVEAPAAATDIPLSFESLPRAQRIAWRTAFRDVGLALFQRGLVPTDFLRTDGAGRYLWSPRS
ncbi:MAG: GNAT family N-acetyltransferase [Alicyclobacillus sp.]|nr:GNAT family N-acetyltransferase [Alicyclobacillus sp.]